MWRLLCLGMLAGCASQVSTPSEDIIGGDAVVRVGGEAALSLPSRWEQVSRAETPFATEGEADFCDSTGFGEDHGTFELETGLCPALDVQQPSLVAVSQGDGIHVIAYHLQLASPDGSGEAHMAIALGDHVVWEEYIAIPSPATPYDVVVTSPVDAPVGTPLTLHIHNHGYNSYNLQSLTLVAPP
jgi:hypothetical protein